MTCSGFRARHLDFVDGTLDAATRAACEGHRDGCAACARLDAQVRRSLLLCHNVRLEQPACDLTARVLAGVRSDRRRRERQAAAWRAMAGWAGIAAAGAFVALGIARWSPAASATSARVATAAVSPVALAAPATASVPDVPAVPVARAPRPLPVLGPMDEPLPVLGDAPSPEPLPAPVWPRRGAVVRSAESGFVSVSLLAP